MKNERTPRTLAECEFTTGFASKPWPQRTMRLRLEWVLYIAGIVAGAVGAWWGRA